VLNKTNSGTGDTYDIMVVEDNAVNALYLTKVLEKAGYNVRSAGNGKLALRSIKTRVPVLIILDIIMEGMDGFEVCRLLKNDENTRSIPIIFITASNDKEDVIKSFKVGGVDFITKPFNNEELLARVNIQMSLYRQQVELNNKNIKFESEIIERKRAEESVHIYQDIVNEMSIGLHVYHLEDIDDDSTLRMISMNSAAELFTGVSRNDVVGKTLDENFPDLRKQGVPRLYAEVVRSGKPMELGDVLYGDDRVKENWFSVRAFPLPDNCMGVTFDMITERKLAEDKLQESERLLTTTSHIAKVGGWKFDIDNQQLTWTEEVYQIHEADLSFIPDIDKAVNFYHPESKPYIEKALQRAIDHG
jgi:CheY-like chemotaxis protein